MSQSRFSERLTIKSVGDNNLKVCGYASVFNLTDSHNDVIVNGAFSKAITSRRIKFLWQHDKTQPIGIINSLHEDDYGLYVEATINSKTQQGREAIALVQQDALNGLSIGFNVVEANYNADGQREITLLDLWEISLVTFPSNDKAMLSHVKNSSDSWKELNKALDHAIAAFSKINYK